MLPTLDSMGAPASFTARRPNASNLPSFELPPPPLASLHQKYQGYSHLSSSQAGPTATTLTSVGNLLTPPSNGSTDGLSPTSGVASSQASYTPNSTGMWPPPNSGSSHYGFQSSQQQQQQQQQQQSYAQQRTGLFSPSLNSMVRGNSSPSASESLPPPPYELPQFAASASLPMSSSSLPAVHSQHQQHHLSGLMGGQDSTAVSQASPISQHDAYSRQPPTPTYYSQPASTNGHSHHNSYSYSTGPSPSAHSPLTSATSSSARMSSSGNAMAPQFNRTYTYPLPGPVLSNVSNPNGQLQMVGGMGGSHGMMPGGFNSGHAAAHLQMYGHHHAAAAAHHQQNTQNDRPFRCDQCPQSFNRNHDLKRHKRIHLAVKPFPCGHCDKSFSRKDALKRHILVKGCGKSQSTTDIKELEGSSSPSTKSESIHNSPIVASV